MTDYIPQCNAITAEKKAWRWRTAVSHKTGGMCRISYREDHPSFHGVAVDSEYLGDADGNPIQAMPGPQELWERHEIAIIPTWTGDWEVRRGIGRHCNGNPIPQNFQPTYTAALAEANRIAGGA